MTNHPWKILLVEDDEDDYLLTRAMLAEAREGKFIMEWARDFESGLNALRENHYDAILLDYNLGNETGLNFLNTATSREGQGPFILLTGHGSYDVDIQAMRAGAADYLDKRQVNALLLERAIRYAIESRQTQEALRRAKDNLENRVQERTRELVRKNEKLLAEIIERKRMEAELAELQRRLIDNTEAERLQLAQDLHDGPIQDLYGLTYQIEALRAGFQNNNEQQRLAGSVQEKLKQVIQVLRATSGELRPPALTPYGLEKAIRSHAEQFRGTQPPLEIRLDLMPDGQRLPHHVRLALFRIYQSAFANVIRHANASQVVVRLTLEADKVILEVQDNGCGFVAPKRWIEMARKGHLGLVGASERAEAVEGKLEVSSRPGEGTLIRVVVPLSR